jgi:penicillin-binding protein 1C
MSSRRRLAFVLRRVIPATLQLLLGWIVIAAAVRCRLVEPRPTLLLQDRHGKFLAEFGSEDGSCGYWPVDPLPNRAAAATIVLEDRRFGRHPGVDFVAVVRAVGQNLRSGRRVSGASTIAMQVARLQDPGDRTYLRKGVEALTAVLLTQRYGREKVLEQYLRLAPYGNGIRGISYAARRYFNKPVEDLSWAETSLLAAIPQSPARMNPLSSDGLPRAIRRARRVLAVLLQERRISGDEYRGALRELARLKMPERSVRPECALHAVLNLERLLKPGVSGERQATPRLILRTTLDLDVQREVSWQAMEAVQSLRSLGAGNAAVIVAERASGEVLAWVGSTDYFDAGNAGAIDFARVPRPSGSTLKPFLYALALERGAITPATILDDGRRGPGGIADADPDFLGPMLPRRALANSRNIPAVQVLSLTGIDRSFSFLGDLGLHDGRRPAGHYGLGLAVGALPVTLEQLVHAYIALADDGVQRDLRWFKSPRKPGRKRVLSEEVARQITLFLSDPPARLPSFPRMGATEYPFPVAIKTGTSCGYRDAWTIAYSQRYVVGVWTGRPDFLPMNQVTGYRGAAPLARRILMFLHHDERDGIHNTSFPTPRGFVAVRICPLTGKLARPECESSVMEWFRRGEEPVEFCNAHFRAAIGAPPGMQPAGRPVLQNASLRVVEPESGSRVQKDPETPAGMATLALQAIADPPVQQIVWYVDGAPFEVVDYPRAARWPLRSGSHTFRAGLPLTNTLSPPVTVTVE